MAFPFYASHHDGHIGAATDLVVLGMAGRRNHGGTLHDRLGHHKQVRLTAESHADYMTVTELPHSCSVSFRGSRVGQPMQLQLEEGMPLSLGRKDHALLGGARG